MEGFAAAVVAIAIVLGAVLVVAFTLFCLVRISTDPEVPFLPTWAWGIAVVCVSPLGGLAYLLCRRLWTRGRSPASNRGARGDVRRRIETGPPS